MRTISRVGLSFVLATAVLATGCAEQKGKKVDKKDDKKAEKSPEKPAEKQ